MIIQFLNQLIVAIVMFFLWVKARTRIRGIGYWTLNIILHSTSLFLFVGRGIWHPLISETTPQILSALGSLLFYFGIIEFLHKPVSKKWYYGILLLFIAAELILAAAAVSRQVQTVMFNLYILFIVYRYLTIFFKYRKFSPWYRTVLKALLWLYSLFFLVTLFRLCVFILFPAQASAALDSIFPALSVSLLITMAILLGVNYCLLILINNTLMRDLSREAKKSKTLLNRMRSLAEHDGLTGISNRTGIEKYLEAELLHRQDAPGRLMVLMLDIDRFKLINDTHGHDAGDRALIAMVKILTGHIRKSDRLGRWGGDEFLLIGRDMEPDAAQDYAERIRTAIEEFPWASVITGAAEPVTVSIGYSMSHQEDSVQTLLKRADLGLYQAKRAGRNRVCCK